MKTLPHLEPITEQVSTLSGNTLRYCALVKKRLFDGLTIEETAELSRLTEEMINEPRPSDVVYDSQTETRAYPVRSNPHDD